MGFMPGRSRLGIKAAMLTHDGIDWAGSAPWTALAGVIALLLIAIATSSRRHPKRRSGAAWRDARLGAYVRRDPMTANEQEFHGRLRSALPSAEIWPQVSMLALLGPRRKPAEPGYRDDFHLVASRRVDWVVSDPGAPAIVGELDDRTHRASDDAARDRVLASVGYQTVRFNSNAKPTPSEIRAALRKAARRNQGIATPE